MRTQLVIFREVALWKNMRIEYVCVFSKIVTWRITRIQLALMNVATWKNTHIGSVSFCSKRA